MTFSKRKKRRKKILMYAIAVEFIILLLTQSDVNINAKAFAITCITFPLIYRCFNKYAKRFKYLHSSLSKVDIMEGEEFEKFLQAHFEKQGYKVSLTPVTGDYGADLILKKGKEKVVVQAKRYKQKVGNSAIQEIVAAKEYYKANKCMVITNSYFTQNAVSLAKANHVELWDRDTLQKKFAFT